MHPPLCPPLRRRGKTEQVSEFTRITYVIEITLQVNPAEAGTLANVDGPREAGELQPCTETPIPTKAARARCPEGFGRHESRSHIQTQTAADPARPTSKKLLSLPRPRCPPITRGFPRPPCTRLQLPLREAPAQTGSELFRATLGHSPCTRQQKAQAWQVN